MLQSWPWCCMMNVEYVSRGPYILGQARDHERGRFLEYSWTLTEWRLHETSLLAAPRWRQHHFYKWFRFVKWHKTYRRQHGTTSSITCRSRRAAVAAASTRSYWRLMRPSIHVTVQGVCLSVKEHNIIAVNDFGQQHSPWSRWILPLAQAFQ